MKDSETATQCPDRSQAPFRAWASAITLPINDIFRSDLKEGLAEGLLVQKMNAAGGWAVAPPEG